MPLEKTEKSFKNREDHTRKAYAGIRQMLFLKEIVPGQKIAYRDLADRLGMSPTPVIQALKWLEFQSLVQHVPNRGYYTTPFSLKEAREIFELRELLELSLLPQAIRHMDETGIRTLSSALDTHLNAKREPYLNERLIKDRDFHLALAALSQTQVQLRTLRNLYDLLYLKYRGGYFSSPPMDTTDDEHRKLFSFVTSKDLKNARRLLLQHLSKTKAHVMENLARIKAEKNDIGLF